MTKEEMTPEEKAIIQSIENSFCLNKLLKVYFKDNSTEHIMFDKKTNYVFGGIPERTKRDVELNKQARMQYFKNMQQITPELLKQIDKIEYDNKIIYQKNE